MDKPDHLFDRTHEWGALTAFGAAARPGASLGLVYGRRRQGKTYLLQSLIEERGGFYWTALSQSSQQNLDRLAADYAAFTGQRAGSRFDDWSQAFTALLALGEGRDEPITVVVDEFPYLLDGDAALPSILQALLAPRGEAVRRWKTSLILCGSALTTMQGLLTASAPLRGRASLELFVHPFGYRGAARFWEVSSRPATAMRLRAGRGHARRTASWPAIRPPATTPSSMPGWNRRCSTPPPPCSVKARHCWPTRSAHPTGRSTPPYWWPSPAAAPGEARSPPRSAAPRGVGPPAQRSRRGPPGRAGG
ncbi:MAG: hypothetical protein R2755_17080 [Acidimicrobiales bacterium]